ncbi:MAG: hypothetical protein P1P82_04490 [Bacteroidales bacterium]|nr:hypothetical protein [Bacteroidales bacterium]
MERQLYNAVLSGEVIVNRLSDWERAIILSYATREIDILTEDIQGMVEVNPGTTFEYWAEKHANYNGALYVKAILINPPRVITKRELALYYYYAKIPINRKNCDIIAKKHGLSGEKLRQEYLDLAKQNDIDRTTPGIFKNKGKSTMIEQYENVIKGLRDNDLDSTIAEKDLKTIKDSA